MMSSLLAREIARVYRDGLEEAEVRELAIHRRLSRLRYSCRCPEASAVQAQLKHGSRLGPGMEIGYMVRTPNAWMWSQKAWRKDSISGIIASSWRLAWEKPPFCSGRSLSHRFLCLPAPGSQGGRVSRKTRSGIMRSCSCDLVRSNAPLWTSRRRIGATEDP